MGTRGVRFILLALTIVFSSSSGLFAENKPLPIALILWRGETEAEQGFKGRLQELGYAVQYTVLNAEQDQKQLGRLVHELDTPGGAGDLLRGIAAKAIVRVAHSLAHA